MGEIASSVIRCSDRGSLGPRILLQYSNFGRTHSNNTCETTAIPNVDCISPLATRFIESSCNGKQRCRIDLPLLRQNYLGENCRVNDPVYLDVQGSLKILTREFWSSSSESEIFKFLSIPVWIPVSTKLFKSPVWSLLEIPHFASFILIFYIKLLTLRAKDWLKL